MLRAIASDIRCLGRRDGFIETVRKVGGGLRGHDVVVIAKRLDEIADIAFDERMELADLGVADLPALAELNARRCDRRATGRFTAALARGEHGFIARLDGEVAGYYWWVDRHHPHLELLGIRLAERDVYGYDFLLAEEYRGDGRAIELLHGIETRLRDRGYRRLWGYVRTDNRPARWLYSMRGYESVGNMHLRLP